MLSIPVFAALFAAGISLADTTDKVLVLGAYGRVFVKPVRRLYFNMTVMLVSVVVALLVGGIEALSLFAGQFHFSRMFWDTVRKLNDNFGTLGYFIVGFFVLSWIFSIAFYKWQRFDDLEVQPWNL
jgi:high-affinity nickel-transport protein